MRIIAGEHRGRKLVGPPGETTRPVTDRVKQSIFDILTPLLPDARVYDVFAGPGSMGLECLSRGAVHATFFEADRAALSALRTNIAALRAGDQATVVGGDLFAWFARSESREAGGRVGLIFLDPPYRFLRERAVELRRVVDQMADRHLADQGLVVFRHDAADTLSFDRMEIIDTRTYGGMVVELLQVKRT